MSDKATYRLLPMDKIVPSKTNPRSTPPATSLKDLADSIAEKGVLQPILARPHPKTKDHFELIAGERRWRASKLAGREEIPAMVRDLDDQQVLEIQVIENDQREDVPPLEQAVGYQRLIDSGYDAAGIAAKIGRPVAYVYNRLELLKLIEPLQKDLASDRIGMGHAVMLCRLRAEQQKYARSELVFDRWNRSGPAVSVKELRRRIHDRMVVNLSSAGWKWDDATLVPEAGACTECPKRSGANRDLFSELVPTDKNKDYCLDPACFQRKANALIQLKVRTAKETHGDGLLQVSTERWSNQNGTLGRESFDIVKSKEAKSDSKAKPAVVVEGDDAGKVVYVRVRREQAGGRLEQNSWERQRQIQLACDRALLKAVYDKGSKLNEAKQTKLLQAAFPRIIDRFWHEHKKQLVVAIGITVDKSKQSHQNYGRMEAALRRHIESASLAEQIASVAALAAVAGDATNSSRAGIIKACSINERAVKDTVRREFADKAKKAKARKKAKASA